MEKLCEYGEVAQIKGATYFICNIDGNPCRCYRYCNTDHCCKMLPNFVNCSIKKYITPD